LIKNATHCQSFAPEGSGVPFFWQAVCGTRRRPAKDSVPNSHYRLRHEKKAFGLPSALKKPNPSNSPWPFGWIIFLNAKSLWPRIKNSFLERLLAFKKTDEY
jgi:hypothetical protein